MTTKAGNQTRTQEQIALSEKVLPLLAELIEWGRISVRLGPLADVKEWLNNYGVGCRPFCRERTYRSQPSGRNSMVTSSCISMGC